VVAVGWVVEWPRLVSLKFKLTPSEPRIAQAEEFRMRSEAL